MDDERSTVDEADEDDLNVTQGMVVPDGGPALRFATAIAGADGCAQGAYGPRRL